MRKDRELIRDLRKQGLSLREISAKTGASKSTPASSTMNLEKKILVAKAQKIHASCEYLYYALSNNSLVEAVLEVEHINTLLNDSYAELRLFHGVGDYTPHKVGILHTVWAPADGWKRLPRMLKFMASEVATYNSESPALWTSTKSRSGLKVTPLTEGIRMFTTKPLMDVAYDLVQVPKTPNEGLIPFAPKRSCVIVNVSEPPSKSYPHTCPKCASPAYVGFSSVECSSCGKY